MKSTYGNGNYKYSNNINISCSKIILNDSYSFLNILTICMNISSLKNILIYL